MSLVFTHYDRTYLCDHEGVLGRAAPDGSRMCVRCGTVVEAQERETFTEPAGNRARRRPERHAPR